MSIFQSFRIALLICLGFLNLQSLFGHHSQAFPVSYEEALRDAERITALSSRWSHRQVVGDALSPYCEHGSLVLLDDSGLLNVRSGMLIVFKDSQGKSVCGEFLRFVDNDLLLLCRGEPRVIPREYLTQQLEGVIFGVLRCAWDEELLPETLDESVFAGWLPRGMPRVATAKPEEQTASFKDFVLLRDDAS